MTRKNQEPSIANANAIQETDSASVQYDDYQEEIFKLVMFSGCQLTLPDRQQQQENKD